MGCPGGSSGGVVVNQGLCAERSQRHFVEIKWAVEFVADCKEGIATGKT